MLMWKESFGNLLKLLWGKRFLNCLYKTFVGCYNGDNSFQHSSTQHLEQICESTPIMNWTPIVVVMYDEGNVAYLIVNNG